MEELFLFVNARLFYHYGCLQNLKNNKILNVYDHNHSLVGPLHSEIVFQNLHYSPIKVKNVPTIKYIYGTWGYGEQTLSLLLIVSSHTSRKMSYTWHRLSCRIVPLY